MREVWPHSVTEEVEKYEKVTLIIETKLCNRSNARSSNYSEQCIRIPLNTDGPKYLHIHEQQGTICEIMTRRAKTPPWNGV